MRVLLDKTLYEALEIELPDGRIIATVPFTPPVLRAIRDLDKARRKGEIDGPDAIVKQIALIYGIEESEVEKIDSRILNDILTRASEKMSEGMGAKQAPAEPLPADVPANEAGLQDPAGDPGPAPDPGGEEKNGLGPASEL
jgi:hypothetical protein